ncbi:MAG: bifunctional serine/threonine-protein kinase/formylglycine-generating enzyme family protein [Bryobacteraceae bacterium]
MALQLPARIGKYELEEFLGGGMSHVYRARDTIIGRTVAVKILTEEGCMDPDAKARFLQEARMAGNIEHPNVINIYDFGEDEQKRPFMVMEFLRGEDLRQAIRAGRAGDLRTKLRTALQVARAIGYIHSLKIIHRDIKPENIHITATGTVKLMDFGIAKTEGLSLTRTGFIMGTPYYMAPEQVMGKPIAETVDIYAFGVLFFELLAEKRPVSGDTIERIFYSILNEDLDLEPLKGAAVPGRIVDLIARCTAKDPAQRPTEFGLVEREIEATLADLETPTTQIPPEVPQKRSPAQLWTAVALGAALLAAVVLLVVVIVRRQGPAPLLPTATGEMVLVSAGSFQFGEHRKNVNLPAFYIDKTEVTNAAYAEFCRATNRPPPKEFAADKPDYPVVNVTISDARDFARWSHKALPTAQQWEKAARGVHGQLFPWGSNQDPSLANVADNPNLPKHQLMQALAFEAGQSPFHALQMVGNVWEILEEPAQPIPRNFEYFKKRMNPPPGPDEPWHAVRGESYEEPLAPGAVWDWGVAPDRWSDGISGFRCVWDPSTQPAPR